MANKFDGLYQRQKKRSRTKKEPRTSEQQFHTGRMSEDVAADDRPAVLEMLSKGSYGEGVAGGEQITARGILSQERSLPILYEATENAHAFADQFIEGIQGKNPKKVDCKEGCAWCCHVRVSITPAEALYIAGYLHYKLSDAEMAEFKNRIAATAAEAGSLSADDRFFARIPCPLLVDNRCSVYQQRPLACRKCNSFDVSACEVDFYDPRGRHPAPMSAMQQEVGGAVLTGLQNALNEWRTDATYLDLIMALDIALNVEEAASKWLRGEPAFAKAYIRTGLSEAKLIEDERASSNLPSRG